MSASPRGGEGALRELVLRLLSPGYPGAAGGEPQLFVGRLPEGLPVEIPVPDGFAVLGSLVRGEGSPVPRGGPRAEVVLDTAMGAERVREAYRDLMGRAGWGEPEPPDRGGGFVFSPPFDHLLFCRSERGPALTVTAHERPGAPTDVRLRLDLSRRGSPCSAERRRGRYPEEPVVTRLSILPRLVPPPGAREYPGGRGGTRGDDFEISAAILEADVDLMDLAAHYAAQLVGGGWTLADEGASGPQAWSSWAFSDDDGQPWAGVFVALGLPETSRRYFLRVHTYQMPEHR